MPDEEMEITTDLGQPGFGEDIDIDLDFVAGQADEDMELGDFDQTQDIENFNSDTRDELMAGGDDASYGMIDADDVDHNEAAAAANDIEIDLGDTDESLWQQNTPQGEGLDNTTEIEYVEEVATENAVSDHLVAAQDDTTWLEEAANSVTEPVDHAGTELANIEVDVTAVTSEDLPLDSLDSTVGVAFRDFGASQGGEEVSKPSDTVDLQHNAPSDSQDQDAANESHDANALAASTEPLSTGHYENNNDEANFNQDVIPDGAITDPEIQGDILDTDSHVEVVKADVDEHGSNDATGEESELGGAVATGSPVEHVDAEQQEYDEQTHGLDLNSVDDQQGDESHIEPTNDQTRPTQGSPQAQSTPNAIDTTDPQVESTYAESSTEDVSGTAATEDESQIVANTSPAETPASVAARYEMYISYGRTDYRLFAKSEDDDPNQFFLDGLSALDLSLERFLSSLRDVISEEISPLDELVIHVDGLGLEFSESSTCDFLEKYTFGDILCLYDKLVKNDNLESLPDLYTYLMVRPNCSQRLMALTDSANAGRGLSEIAVYRDSTPFEDEHVSASGSPVPEMSPDDEGDEGDDQSEENDYEDDAFDSIVEAEDSTETKPHLENASTGEVKTEDAFAGQTETPTENTSNSANAGTTDELTDYSDEESEASPSKQDNSTYPYPRDHTTDPQEEHYDPETTETGELSQHSPPTIVADVLVDIPSSDHTSATATLNGDEQDEIDYSDEDEVEDGSNDKSTPKPSPDPVLALEDPVDDEITWESENEDTKNEVKAASKETVQVSPAPGKRARSDSDRLEGASEENDVKRRRS